MIRACCPHYDETNEDFRGANGGVRGVPHSGINTGREEMQYETCSRGRVASNPGSCVPTSALESASYG
jgi:hypothetical protein